eukprot:TRINITY_DN3058_c1_g1_i2.p1 TRINITY_DN3058_c1_g1~~TRINITY_DN3058_c1_g1_i2.p1  ORF type:complete len:658 (-),score=54.21 TRINITY_DN3058_c1_g1_i2:487-2433(-)
MFHNLDMVVELDCPIFQVQGQHGYVARTRLVGGLGMTVRVTTLLLTLFAIWIVCHGVNRELMSMCLTYFDPWVFTICAIRLQASLLYSRYTLTEDAFSLGADLVTLFTGCFGLWMVILLEACDGSWYRKAYALTIVWVVVFVFALSCHLPSDDVNWDPGATLDIFWLAPMSPKSQYTNALGTILVLLSKAVWNLVIRRKDFMFLHTHLKKDDVNDVLSTGLLYYPDWQSKLKDSGIPDAHIPVAFRSLDVTRSGCVDNQVVQEALMALTLAYAVSMTTNQRMRLLCQQEFSRSLGASLLPRMVQDVVGQWEDIDIRILREEIGATCSCEGLEMLSLLSSLMTKLKNNTSHEWKSELDECSRHQLGALVSCLPGMQVNIFATLEKLLGHQFICLLSSWSCVWQVFFTSSIIQSYVSESSIISVACCAWPSQVWIERDKQAFLQQMLAGPPGAFAKLQSANSLHQTFLESRSRACLDSVLGFTKALIAWNYSGMASMIGALFKMCSEHGLSVLQLQCLEESFQCAAKELFANDFTNEMSIAWACVWHEIIDRLLHVALAGAQEELDKVLHTSKQTLDRSEFRKCFSSLDLDDSVLRLAFEQLALEGTICEDEATSQTVIVIADLKRSLLVRSMFYPMLNLREILSQLSVP